MQERVSKIQSFDTFLFSNMDKLLSIPVNLTDRFKIFNQHLSINMKNNSLITVAVK